MGKDYSKILEYQEIDKRVFNIEREIKSSQYNKAVIEAGTTIKKIQELIDKLGGDANQQLNNYSIILHQYEKLKKEVKELANNTTITDEEKSKQIDDLNAKLGKLNKNISIMKGNIDLVNGRYEEAKKNMVEAKKKYADNKAKQEEFSAGLLKEVEELKIKMGDIKNDIDAEIFQLYSSRKADKIVLPIFVHILNGDACGGCGQGLSIGGKDKLSEYGAVACEHCKRIIIN